MLEIIKEAGAILKDLPDLAIWILLGILFYKVFIIGSSMSLAKFAISKLHDWKTKPQIVEHKYMFNDLHIADKETMDKVLSLMQKLTPQGSKSYTILHSADIEKAYQILMAYKENSHE